MSAFFWGGGGGGVRLSPKANPIHPHTLPLSLPLSLITYHAGRAPIRVYCDGCFDMLHYGHANALRQAAALGDELVVGLIPDSEIVRCKGAPPVLNEAERGEMVGSLKWVDEVMPGVPYDLTPEFLRTLFTKHRIDLVVHGDDPCLLPDGSDAYAHAKAQGRFRVVKRTEGVSSTDLVGRALMGVRDRPGPGAAAARAREAEELARQFSSAGSGASKCAAAPRPSMDAEAGGGGGQPATPTAGAGPGTPLGEPATPPPPQRAPTTAAGGGGGGEGGGGEGGAAPPAAATAPTHGPTPISRFLPTARRIVQFAGGAPPAPPPGCAIIYMDGAFDLFHPGHVAALQAARALGGFLLVGLHGDEDVASRRGPGRPILDLHERALSVLACRYVDEVVIGAPAVISADLLTTFNIALVVRGSVSEGGGGGGGGGREPPRTGSGAPHGAPSTSGGGGGEAAGGDRYAVPRACGLFRRLASPSPLTAAALIDRIVSNRAAYEARNAKKVVAEAAYYAGKREQGYVQEG